MLTRSTRSSTRAAAAMPIEPVALPLKKRATKKSAAAPLADRTNAAAATPMVDDAAPVKEVLSFAGIDLDALTAVADKEEVAASPAPIQQAATTTVPAQPSLVYAQIDSEILALKVKRAPINTAAVASIAPIAAAAPIAESRRVQFEYNEDGCEIGQHIVAPAYPAIAAADEDEETESAFTHGDNEEDAEDLTRLGEVDRMTMPAASVDSALPALFHASALTKHSVGQSTSGFLPSGLVSSHAVRSVKLDMENDAPVPACMLATALSNETNQIKANGFLAAGSIDAHKIGSKKIA